MLWDYLFGIIWEVIKKNICVSLPVSQTMLMLCPGFPETKACFILLWFRSCVFGKFFLFTWLWQEIFRKVKKSQAMCRMPSLLVLCAKPSVLFRALVMTWGHCKLVSTWKLGLCINHYLVLFSQALNPFSLHFLLCLAHTRGRVAESRRAAY